MDYFYDGQIRRYITQFMRVFIGFKYQSGDGEQKHVPVSYGDMTRQVAAIIRENSENKLPSVPRIACYMTGLELDATRLADATFVSKLNLRERAYQQNSDGTSSYQSFQGGGYTVERLMPTPFKLSLKADIWTSNTDQKLQLMEQILVLFNPSLELQTTDNYVDWTSLTVLDLTGINPSSRSIPQGADSEIDIASLEFVTPIYISPPTKVKKLGVVKNIIANVFAEDGSVQDINTLIYNQNESNAEIRVTIDNHEVVLLKGPEGTGPYDYYLRFQNWNQDDWRRVLDLHGGYTPTSLIHFLQPTGFEITGTFEVNELDPEILVVTLDPDTIPTNDLPAIDRIVDPYNFNPITFYNGNIPVGVRLLILESINDPQVDRVGADDAWINLDSAYSSIPANSIIEWTGDHWAVDFDPENNNSSILYVQHATTMVQYRWDGEQWLRSFEGEYAVGYWRLDLD